MTIPFNKWQRSSNYMGEDYSDHYIIYSRTRDSEALTKANYETTKTTLEENNIDYIEPTFNHWACGWISAIMIHQSNKDALTIATNKIHEPLQEYPLLDEDLYYQYEQED